MMARPTYAEEFENMRGNINKFVVPNDPASWMQSQLSQDISESAASAKSSGRKGPHQANRRSSMYNNEKDKNKEPGEFTFKSIPTVRFKDENIEEVPSKPKSPPDSSTPTTAVKGILSPRGLVTENITKEEKLNFKMQQKPRKRHLSDRALNKGALRNELNIEE